jgi:hypothetical protein
MRGRTVVRESYFIFLKGRRKAATAAAAAGESYSIFGGRRECVRTRCNKYSSRSRREGESLCLLWGRRV